MIGASPSTTLETEHKHSDRRRSAVKRIIVFFVIIVAAGLIGRWIDGADVDATESGPGALLWLVTPLIAAVVITRLTPDSLPWGLRPNFSSAWPWYVFALVVFPLIALVLIGVGSLIDTVVITPDVALGSVLAAIAVAVPVSLVKNLFEELSWRGYLMAEVTAVRLSRLTTHLVVGAIWGIWHLPYLDSFAATYHDLHWTTYVPLFLVGIVITAVIYGEVRLRSGTVWPPVIMHTMANATVNTLFFEDHIELDSDRAWLVSPAVDNLGNIIVAAGIAAVLLSARQRRHHSLA